MPPKVANILQDGCRKAARARSQYSSGDDTEASKSAAGFRDRPATPQGHDETKSIYYYPDNSPDDAYSPPHTDRSPTAISEVLARRRGDTTFSAGLLPSWEGRSGQRGARVAPPSPVPPTWTTLARRGGGCYADPAYLHLRAASIDDAAASRPATALRVGACQRVIAGHERHSAELTAASPRR